MPQDHNSTPRALPRSRARPYPPHVRPLGLSLLLITAACEGDIGDLTLGARGAIAPDAGALGGPEFNPFEGGTITFGAVCDASGSARGRFIFTSETASCERHAQLLEGAPADGDWALFDSALITGPGVYELDGEVCLDGACAVRTVTLELDAIGPSGAIGFWSIPVLGRTATGPLSANPCAYDNFDDGPNPNLAPDIRITDVAIYQGVKISLLPNPLEMTPRPPVVQGRSALVRVFVEPQPGFLQTPITAAFTTAQRDGPVRTRRQTREIAIASREQGRGTTFEFMLDPEDLREDTEWSVELLGAEACSGVGVDTSGARRPTEGTQPIDAEKVGTLDVTLVPMRYNGDGSGSLPDTSEAQQAIYREVLMRMFPVEEVNISVRDTPVDIDFPVRVESDWGPVLNLLLDTRAMDVPPAKTYYYGLLGGGSGLGGLGPVPGPGSVNRRGAIGVGRSGFGPAETCAHELGHASGRRHSPCGGAGNPDPTYPHDGGSIGVWGYDIFSDTLKDPENWQDFMSYCSNEWVSDFTYRALAQRHAFVNASAKLETSEVPTAWRSLVLFANNDLQWGQALQLDLPPQGDPVPVRYLDATGELLYQTEGVLTVLDHSDSLLARIPEPELDVFFVELMGERYPYP